MGEHSAAAGLAAGRRDREHYFVAAYDLLAERGPGGLTVAALCERVGVTKGSFYHHFVDLPEFVGAFARRWQSWLEHMFADYLAEPDVLRRIELMLNSHIAAMTGAEPAIRGWGRAEPAIATALREIDRYGEEVSRRTLTELVGDAETGEMLARMIVLALTGMQQRAQPTDPERFIRIGAEWARRFLHLDVEEVRVAGRLCVRVRGPNGTPVPHFRRPQTMPNVATPGAPAFDASVQAGVTRMMPAADRGRGAYFRTAWELLAEHGPDGITVAALCIRLGVTKGSFHHHFSTMPGFVVALAEYYETSTNVLYDYFADRLDPVARLAAIFQAVLTQNGPAESAWRAWGRFEPVIAAALHRIDAYGERLTRDTFRELLRDAGQADLMAELGIGLALGIQQATLDLETAALTALEFLHRCVGLEAHLVLVDGVPCLVPNPDRR